ncbi:Putative peptidyl-prolyl cis-trans isomerase [Rosistilla carotiformis]|uniref:peptidylprolyl isomerase n=2 Tax=Rosistilla carotiformis TaxID=2528017 RepID=A0A518JPB8_9BACT|nr:Putative peptidyl-prolyl cis-trans isomerase [Rosistilla carotiformis]
MAGDVDLLPPIAPASDETVQYALTSSVTAEGETTPEGEAAPDLVAFAKALSDGGVVFFGAAWCPNCTDQKELFEDGQNYLPFVEVTNPDHSLNATGTAEGISSFPTWRFQDGTEVEGVLSLADISQRSGIAIPQGETPSFVPVGNQTVGVGSPLHIPIDAYDPDGQPLTVTVTSSDPSLLEASVISGNRSLRLKIANYGDMVFELYEQRAERPTARIIELTEDGFYDGITFHRILDDFVLQAGDPTATGAGGSDLGDFDDQFHEDLQHNATGILSYAKTSDDTNDSQFFITEGDSRHLDFNHSIFGQLVEGEAVRDAISEVPTDSTGRLTTAFANAFGQITIEEASIFTDNENSVIMLKPTGSGTGPVNVTITVTDSDGNQTSQVITVNVTADNQLNSNGKPFLGDLSDVATTAGQAATIQLSSTDVEGDAVTYAAFKVGSVGYTTSVNQSTGEVTVTPPAGFVGTFEVQVGVKAASSTVTQADSTAFDLQTLSVTVQASALQGVTLNAASDTGVSNSDGITSSTNPTFTISGTTAGSTVELLSGSTVIGTAVATGTTTQITTTQLASNGNGTYSISARQTSGGTTSAATSPITVVYDSSAPAAITTQIATQATAGSLYTIDLTQAEEGNGVIYSLANGPAGMTIDAQTGVVTWTPTTSQLGDQTFSVKTTDQAGNSRDNSFSVNVGSETTVSLEMSFTDLAGNPITQLQRGDEFLLNITAIDHRLISSLKGVAAAYLDILYNQNLAEPVGTNLTINPTDTAEDIAASPFTFTSLFNDARLGSAATPGLIDELGAFATSQPGLEAGLVSIHFRALNAGVLVFTGDPADGNGTEVLVHGSDDELEPSEVNFGTASIEIVSTFVAADDIYNFDEDSANNAMDVLSNDQLLTAGTTLTIVGTSTPLNGGTVTIVEGGQSLSYTPAANINGADEFTYTVEDQNGSSQTVTVSVGLQPVNDAPTAVADTFDNINRGSTGNVLEVLDNDIITPDENETLRVISVGTTSNGGTVTIASGGSYIQYTPATNFSGTETFSYTISDRTTGGLTSTATVTVNVSALSTGTHTFTVVEDAAAATFDVLTGDRAANPDESNITLQSIVSTSNGGTALITSDGTVQYKPAANFNGTETVTYTIRSDDGDTGTGTITFTVTEVNDPPVAVTDEFQVGKSAGSTTLDVLANDTTGVDTNETLKITAVDGANLTGTVTISSDGLSLVYTPNGTFTGTETFSYTIMDRTTGGLTASATVSVTVLDYVPRDFNFTIESTFLNAFGFDVTLTGTDDFGNAVNATVTVDAAGTFSFADQAPGSYTLTVPAIPFLIGAEQDQVFTIDSDMDDGDYTAPTIEIGAMHPSYIAIRDWFGSTSRESVVLAVVQDGDTPGFNLQVSKLASGLADPAVTLNDDGSSVIVTATSTTSTDGGQISSVLDIDSNAVDMRGQQGGFMLIRVNTPAATEFTPVSSTSAASGTAAAVFAEGEASSSAIVLPLGSADVWEQQAASSTLADSASDDDEDEEDQAAVNDIVFAEMGDLS